MKIRGTRLAASFFGKQRTDFIGYAALSLRPWHRLARDTTRESGSTILALYMRGDAWEADRRGPPRRLAG